MSLRSWARRCLCTSIFAAALLLSSCGAQADTELATIDGAATDVSGDADAPTTVDDPASVELGAVLDAQEEDEYQADAFVPEAVVPPAPGPAASPAQRQLQQELGLVAPAADRDAPAGASVGTDVSGPVADESIVTDGRRIDPDLFPATIPAVVPGAPTGPNQDGPLSTQESRRPYVAPPRSRDVELPPASAPTSGADASEAIGVESGDIDLAEAAAIDAAAEEVADADVTNTDACALGSCEENDPAMRSGHDSGDGHTDQDTAGGDDRRDDPSSDDTASGAPDCERRPYDRGCPLPGVDDEDFGVVADPADESASGEAPGDAVPDTGANSDDASSDGDTGDHADGGVHVPQEVIDALLAPLRDDDVDLPASGSDPAQDDESPADPTQLGSDEGGSGEGETATQ